MVAPKAPVIRIASTGLSNVSAIAPSMMDMYVVSLSIARFSITLSLLASLLDSVKTTCMSSSDDTDPACNWTCSVELFSAF